jgi:hypothetical protein
MLEVSDSEDHAHHDLQVVDERSGDSEEVASPTEAEALTIKIAAGVGKTDDGSMSILATALEPNATSPSRPSEVDAASTHSLPVSQVTETQPTQTRPSTAHLNSSGAPAFYSSAGARTQQYSTVESTVTAGERTNRRRSNIEVRT